MILKKNRSPNVQSRMIGTQHVTEAEATAGQEVSAIRIPPGAIMLGGFVEVVEAYSAGTLGVDFVNGDGTTADVALAAAVDATATGATDASPTTPLRAPQGGWIVLKPAGTDPAQAGGDVLVAIEYIVDGRWTEVMPEAGLVPDDVAA